MSDSETNAKNNLYLIPLSQGKFAIVDPEDFTRLNCFKWYAVKSGHCWYALRKEYRGGKTYKIRMHRDVAQTPPGMVTHHKNGNPLDNRKINLDNMYPLDHRTHHIVYRHQKRIADERRKHQPSPHDTAVNISQPSGINTR